MKKTIIAGIVTVGLILWAHQLTTVGSRVPLVFVALWFGSATMVAFIFSMNGFGSKYWGIHPSDVNRQQMWRSKMRMTISCLLPLTFVPLLEIHGVGGDPAVWLLDSALFISVCSVPYFTLVARTVVGGVALSMGAFQLLWTCGAIGLFFIMEHLENAKGGRLAQESAFEEFLRPEYRYLFYILCALMLLVYCPILLWLSHQRFLYQKALSEKS